MQSTVSSFHNPFLACKITARRWDMEQAMIGEFISACRKEKGLTQMQLAEKLNITNRAVSK